MLWQLGDPDIPDSGDFDPETSSCQACRCLPEDLFSHSPLSQPPGNLPGPPVIAWAQGGWTAPAVESVGCPNGTHFKHFVPLGSNGLRSRL